VHAHLCLLAAPSQHCMHLLIVSASKLTRADTVRGRGSSSSYPMTLCKVAAITLCRERTVHIPAITKTCCISHTGLTDSSCHCIGIAVMGQLSSTSYEQCYTVTASLFTTVLIAVYDSYSHRRELQHMSASINYRCIAYSAVCCLHLTQYTYAIHTCYEMVKLRYSNHFSGCSITSHH
jgi:hypothetical protein